AFSLAQRLRVQFDQDEAARLKDDARLRGRASSSRADIPASSQCTRTSQVSVLSIVGTILSLRTTTTTACEREAHPSGETSVIALDLAGYAAADRKTEAAKAVKLTDYFPDSTVFEALRQDTLVRNAMQSGGSRPANLTQLLAALASAPPVMDDKLCYSFPDDLLFRFAFHHQEGGRVAVRLGLPGAGPCRENLTQIGLLLPAPQTLSSAISLAATRKAGFLMQESGSIAKARATSITFATKR